MTAFLNLLVGLFVTMVLIPPLVRVSAQLRLLDQPNARKVHVEPIPRIGGIAIYVGVLMPLLLWAPLDGSFAFYLVGSGLIVLFGAIDDRHNLVFKWKFAGQVLAIVLVMIGGIRFDVLPFFGLDPVTPWITYPISFLFLLGVTNAINLSDGLDGLAGGVSLLSLAAIAALSYAAGGATLYMAAAALIGAILGFLRFNTHPAVVFLGDAGSQFLGLTLASMTIMLTQDLNPALNSTLPLFIVGLPLLDTLSVIVIRLKNRRSPFAPDNRHFHHRLLGIGLRHYEAVAVIYALQALIIVLGFLNRYQSDALAFATFLVFSALVYSLMHTAEAMAWRVRPAPVAGQGSPAGFVERRNMLLRRIAWLPMASAYYVQLGVAAFLIGGTVFADPPPRDIAVVAAGVAVMLIFAHFFLNLWTRLFVRVGVYLLSLFVVFLIAPMTASDYRLDWAVDGYLVALCAGLALAIRLTRRETFQMTPQDLLVLFVVLAIPNLPVEIATNFPVGTTALRAVVVFYACEYVLNRNRMSYRSLRVASFIGLAILGFRGLI